jgi:hypothetical protein
MNQNQSLEEIENQIWGDLVEYPTNLVRRVHEIRKKKIKDLTADDYRVAISQSMGLEIFMPIATSIITTDILTHALYYPGDLLLAVLDQADFWYSHRLEKKTLSKHLIDNLEKVTDSEDINEEIRSLLLSKIYSFIPHTGPSM